MTARVGTGVTRREAIARALAAAATLYAAGCGSGSAAGGVDSGSTLVSTWADRGGEGVLARSGGEALIHRAELAPAAATGRTIATIAHLTDAHVLDASSPARVTFLDRLGPPFQSTFRPQETLSAQVLAGAVHALGALQADLVVQGGDLIDNAQANELAQAIAVLEGGQVHPGSGRRGYFGVQVAENPDPFYYRPDLDAPRYPGLLGQAAKAFTSPGIRRARYYPVLGDHDILVAGEIPPSPQTQALATGDEALWELPRGLQAPPGARLTPGDSPDGPPDPGAVNALLHRALAGAKVRVPPDPARRELLVPETIGRLRRSSGLIAGRTLDYTVEIGGRLMIVVLDLARRQGGSGGLVRAGQPAWLAGRLAAAAERRVVVFSHQSLESSEGGGQLLALLDAHPQTIAAVSGHTHRNEIRARRTGSGGYWQISTGSLIDYPQQVRALRLCETAGGGIAIQTWMLDHVFPGPLGRISRQLSYLDAQGGRPRGFVGQPEDRNAVLYLPGTS
ncbi:MAG: hypothetical protein M3Z27_01440 [Actinomycetota bacterium]|nr:hypothetical protein [Actinomycetota bacterium]